MSTDVLNRAAEIIQSRTGQDSYCTLSLIDDDGYPTTSAISVSKHDGIRWLTFDTGLGSNKANRIRKNPHACVNFASETYNITLVGEIEIVTDAAVKKEMWYDGMSHHFSGPEDPDYCVLRFTTRRYSLFIDWQETAGTL